MREGHDPRRRTTLDDRRDRAVVDVVGVGIRERRSASELIVALTGELDSASSAELSSRLPGLRFGEAGIETVTVDMGGLRFLDSSGISALIEMRRRAEAHGLGFRLVNLLETQEQALDIVGVRDHLGVEEPGGPEAGPG